MKTKNIDLGYVHMESYVSGDSLDPYAADHGHVPVKPKEVVLTEGVYNLVITYPLSNPFKKEFKVSSKGMTRRQLVALVVKSYKKIYADEDKDVGGKTGNIPGMFNRDTSEGRYGVWGHCLGDLVLHTATLQKSGNVTIGCDS